MGKKKDKAAKSKKKKLEAASVVDTDSEDIQYAEDESGGAGYVAEPEHIEYAENIEYAESVTAGDVMELINTLSLDLEQLNNSNQSLQHQISQSEKKLQKRFTLYGIITLILFIGVVTVGQPPAGLSSHKTESLNIVSAEIDQITGQLDTIHKSIGSTNRGLKNLNTGMSNLSTSVSTANENIDKIAGDVRKLNTLTASQPYDPWRTAQPMNRSYWR